MGVSAERLSMDKSIKTAAEAAEAEAIPRVHEVHSDPAMPNAANKPVPQGVTNTPAAQKSPARWAYERIIMYLKNFEESLDNAQEVSMGFTGSEAGVMRIEGMGYFDPDIVTFYGTDTSGARTQQIQHVSQLNVVLRAVPKAIPTAEPNRIGFRLAEDLDSA